LNTYLINGDNIIVPLEMYELQPIVNFSNSADEVLVTMYGQMYGAMNNCESEQIIFHPAFVDNIMGLRLLQVDALTMLGGRNGEFPIFEGNTYCLTDSEREKYEKLNKQFKAKGSSYENNAQEAFQEIMSVISNISSYIFTDIDQPIHFTVSNNSVSFTGLPYYQFSKVVENELDKLACYYSCRYFCNNYESLVPELVEYFVEETEAFIPEQQMDSLREVMVPALNEFYGTVCDEFMSIDGQKSKSDEQKADELMKRFDDSENQLLVQLFLSQLSQIMPKQVSDTEATNRLKANPDLIRSLNPIVYEEVDNICQWSALFRFVKTKNLAAWNTFVSQVNRVKSNAPSVKTPIGIQSQGFGR
jgi:HSP90 family molecular chaperone